MLFDDGEGGGDISGAEANTRLRSSNDDDPSLILWRRASSILLLLLMGSHKEDDGRSKGGTEVGRIYNMIFV